MKYFKFQDKKLSRLGFGIMRLPSTAPGGSIDEEKAKKLISHAYKSGINYFDTAFFYHEGKSEDIIGRNLSKFPRETWYLANKFPGNASWQNGPSCLQYYGPRPVPGFPHIGCAKWG